MKRIESYGSIDNNGKLSISYRDKFIDLLKQFSGCRIKIIIEKAFSKRTLDQNAYFHSILPFLVEQIKNTGNILTTEEVKLMLKVKFLKESICDKDGVVIGERIKSTSELNKAEFSDFMQDVNDWCIEFLNCPIPTPGEQQEMPLNIN